MSLNKTYQKQNEINNQSNADLLSAIISGDLLKFQEFLRQGANLEDDFFQGKVVSRIVDTEHDEVTKIEMIKSLLAQKISMKSNNISIALGRSISLKNIDLAKLLISNGVNAEGYIMSLAYKGYNELFQLATEMGTKLPSYAKDILSYTHVSQQAKYTLSKALNTDTLFDGIEEGKTKSTSTMPIPPSLFIGGNDIESFLKKAPRMILDSTLESISSDQLLSRAKNDFMMGEKKRAFKPSELKLFPLKTSSDEDKMEQLSKSTKVTDKFIIGKKIQPSDIPISLPRFNAVLNKKIGNIFECYAHRKLKENSNERAGINKTANNKSRISDSADKNSLIENLQNLFAKVIDNLEKSSLFISEDEQRIDQIKEIFDSNNFLKMYYDDFNNYNSKKFIPSLKFHAEIDLLLKKYMFIKNGEPSKNIADKLHYDLKAEMSSLVEILFINEHPLTKDKMIKFVNGEDSNPQTINILSSTDIGSTEMISLTGEDASDSI